ncbi:MAG TPA: hypothetical protein VN823_07360 [Stellaceae bacterium]|nr:hypothetical protein [Stellaceae bacterium]
MPVAPDFLAAMAETGMMPLWDRYHQLLRPEPSAPDRPFQWRWAELQPFINRAAAEVTMDEAERRVLMLVNADFGGLDLPLSSYLGAIFAEGGASYDPRSNAPSFGAAGLRHAPFVARLVPLSRTRRIHGKPVA